MDIEGAVYDVLRTFPFNKYGFDFINVEATHKPLENIEILLDKVGYCKVQDFPPLDVMFGKKL